MVGLSPVLSLDFSVQLLDLTLPTAAENLALDEALLDQAETCAGAAHSFLRLWESPEPAVVLGRSGKVADEVNQAVCARLGVGIFRRASGGGTVVIGPGCLQYSLVLSVAEFPQLASIAEAHAFVLERVAAGVERALADELLPQAPGILIEPVQQAGDSDLLWNGRKFSGNSLRIKRHCVLYHGTLLYDYPLERVSALLREPARQPEYRKRKPHGEFITNLPVSANALRLALAQTWRADSPAADWPREQVARLTAEKYRCDAWNLER